MPTGPRTEAPGWAKEYPGLYTSKAEVLATIKVLGQDALLEFLKSGSRTGLKKSSSG